MKNHIIYIFSFLFITNIINAKENISAAPKDSNDPMPKKIEELSYNERDKSGYGFKIGLGGSASNTEYLNGEDNDKDSPGFALSGLIYGDYNYFNYLGMRIGIGYDYFNYKSSLQSDLRIKENLIKYRNKPTLYFDELNHSHHFLTIPLLLKIYPLKNIDISIKLGLKTFFRLSSNKRCFKNNIKKAVIEGKNIEGYFNTTIFGLHGGIEYQTPLKITLSLDGGMSLSDFTSETSMLNFEQKREINKQKTYNNINIFYAIFSLGYNLSNCL